MNINDNQNNTNNKINTKISMDQDMHYAATNMLNYISNAGALGGKMVKRMIQSEEEKLMNNDNSTKPLH